jgi:hypothetical protein
MLTTNWNFTSKTLSPNVKKIDRGEKDQKVKPGGLDLSRRGLDRDSRSRHF